MLTGITRRSFRSPCTSCAPSSTRSLLPLSPTAPTWWSTASPRPCPTAEPRCSRCPTSAATRRSRSCPTWVPPRRAQLWGGVCAHRAEFQPSRLWRVVGAPSCCGWKRSLRSWSWAVSAVTVVGLKWHFRGRTPPAPFPWRSCSQYPA